MQNAECGIQTLVASFCGHDAHLLSDAAPKDGHGVRHADLFRREHTVKIVHAADRDFTKGHNQIAWHKTGLTGWAARLH
jgi:hypothetical protein